MGFFRVRASGPLIRIKHRRTVRQDSLAFALEILELTAIERPSEDGQQRQHQ